MISTKGSIYIKNKKDGSWQKLLTVNYDEIAYTDDIRFYRRLLNEIEWYGIDDGTIRKIFNVLKLKYDIGDTI